MVSVRFFVLPTVSCTTTPDFCESMRRTGSRSGVICAGTFIRGGETGPDRIRIETHRATVEERRAQTASQPVPVASFRICTARERPKVPPRRRHLGSFPFPLQWISLEEALIGMGFVMAKIYRYSKDCRLWKESGCALLSESSSGSQ